MPIKVQHSKSRSAVGFHALHGIWMTLVVLALLVSSAPAAQWVAFLTKAVKTSHQVQLVHRGCDVYVVLKHSVANGSSQIQAQPWKAGHQHTTGDNLLGFFGRTLDTQQDHVIQLPCEGSSIGAVEASQDAFCLDPDNIKWSCIQTPGLALAQAEISPKPISIPGDFSNNSRLGASMLVCMDTTASLQATVLLI